MSLTLPLLTFHDLVPRTARGGFPVAVFERGMRRLHEKGFRAVDLRHAIEQLEGGGSLEARSFAIAFDDGYRSAYEFAFPLLGELGFTATIFAITGGVAQRNASGLPEFEGRSMLRWCELEEMQRSGFAIGSHSMTHPDLLARTPEEQEAEVRDSKRVLEDHLGVAVDCFAYPFGRYDDRVLELAREHYGYAFSSRLGLVDPVTDRHLLERIDMSFFCRDFLFPVLSRGVLGPYLSVQQARLDLRRGLWNRVSR